MGFKDCDFKIASSTSGQLTATTFQKALDGRPIVFRNLTSDWLATRMWANKESFIQRHGHLRLGLREQVVRGSFDLNMYVDMLDDSGAPPIHMAAQEGHSDCVQLFVRHGSSREH